jgi:hypothetical protein
VSYLRFTPDDYRALASLWETLSLRHETPYTVKRRLVEALAQSHSGLAVRLAGFHTRQLRVLCDHLRGRKPIGRHGLNAGELRLLTRAAGGLLSHVRFIQPMRRFLVQHFRDKHPSLAEKLHTMSLGQFELLCRQAG